MPVTDLSDSELRLLYLAAVRLSREARDPLKREIRLQGIPNESDVARSLLKKLGYIRDDED